MNPPKTTLWISPEILSKLMYYAWSVDAEVGGYGRLSFDEEENDIFIEDVFIVKQEVCQTECTLSKEGLSELFEEFIANGEEDKIGEVTLWWHSHKDMAAFFSGTDDECMRTWPGKYVVSLVINRKMEMKASLMTKTPLLIVGDIDVRIDWLDVPNREKIEEDIEKKVIETKTVIPIKNKQQELMYNYAFNTAEGKSFHDMTDDEWAKVEKELDKAEDKFWEKYVDEYLEEDFKM